MPTDEWFKENPKVSAYIPQDLNEKLTEWMKGRNIKKVSQALTAILEEYLKVVQTEPTTQPVKDDRLETLEQRFESLFQEVKDLRKAFHSSSSQVIQTELPLPLVAQIPVEPVEEPLSVLEAIALLDAKQPIEVVEEIQDDEPDEVFCKFFEPETQAAKPNTQKEAIETTESDQAEESSPKVEKSSSFSEITENEGVKPIMTNAEVSQLLNEPLDAIRYRSRHQKEFKAKGYQFTPVKEKSKPRWKVERLEDEF